jgi:hypothetical protein
MWWESIETGLETGLTDITGKPILTGDIVEFFFDFYQGYSSDPECGYTRMRDIVSIEETGEVMFMCRMGGCFTWRAVSYCRVIGTDPSLIDT